jgi:Ni,Fe-hydrogenase III large subunit
MNADLLHLDDPHAKVPDLLPHPLGRATPVSAVPVWDWLALRAAVAEAVHGGGKLLALFGHRDPPHAPLDVWAVVDGGQRDTVFLGRARLQTREFFSMCGDVPQAHLCERELAEEYGTTPLGHPWPAPVRAQPGLGIRYRIDGAATHEVAVGPVHAGVIEPGHFRFQCWGEHVQHLEIALGYQHRGVERAIVEGPTKRVMHYVETLAGDTTIGHATAHAHVAEALSGVAPAPHAVSLRALALELERLANHVGDLGAIAGDVAFLPTQSWCGRLRGDFLNLTQLVCGNRFGRALVVPGGVRFDVDAARRAELRDKLTAAGQDVEDAVTTLLETPSAMARFDGTGAVSASDARQLGFVGVAARACGLDRDARRLFPHGTRWQQPGADFVPARGETGDVMARVSVRWQEVQASLRFCLALLADAAAWEGAAKVACASPAPPEPMLVVGICEGWRGEIMHVGITAASASGWARYKVVDPSFWNWKALELALRGQPISDFPLCNKSFNLSYCGHDL